MERTQNIVHMTQNPTNVIFAIIVTKWLLYISLILSLAWRINLFPWLCIAILPLSTPSSCFVSIRIITYDELLHAEILWNLLNSCFSLSSKLLKMARQQFLTMKLCCSSLEKIIISFYVFQPWAGGILQTKKIEKQIISNRFQNSSLFFACKNWRCTIRNSRTIESIETMRADHLMGCAHAHDHTKPF